MGHLITQIDVLESVDSFCDDSHFPSKIQPLLWTCLTPFIPIVQGDALFSNKQIISQGEKEERSRE